MKSKIENFLNSTTYILLISFLTFIFWLFNFGSIGPSPNFDVLEIIGISLFAIVIGLILIFYEETIYIFPLVIHTIFMLSNQNLGMETLNELWALYVVLGLVVTAFIYHFIKYKVKLTPGFLFKSLFLVALSFILSMSGYFLDQKPFELSILFISLLGFIYLLLYIFFNSTTKKAYLNYLFQTLVGISILVILQTITMIIIYFIDNAHIGSFIDILKYAIDYRWIYVKDGLEVRLNVGWGNANNIAGILVMLLPTFAYFIFTDSKIKTKLISTFLMVVSMITIVITTSRGAYLGLVGFVLLFIYLFFKYAQIDYKKYKKQVIITLSILALLAIPVGYFMIKFLISFLESGNSFLNGREEDWSDAIKYFLEYPVFGKSWYSDTWMIHSFRSYHNTILHTMATMGTFGLLTFIYFQVDLVRLFKRWLKLETIIVASMLIITHIHGMVDNTYYTPTHIIILLVSYVGIEKSIQSNTIKKIEI